MDTEFVVHIHNGRLLNYKKNTSESALMRWMNLEPIIQMWSKSKRERQILYINACVWNLERWYWWTCLQGRKGDTDIENRLADTEREGEGGMNWESSEEAYTLPYPGQDTGVGSLSLLQRICPTQGLNPGFPHCRRILYQLRRGKPMK